MTVDLEKLEVTHNAEEHRFLPRRLRGLGQVFLEPIEERDLQQTQRCESGVSQFHRAPHHRRKYLCRARSHGHR